MDVKQTIDLLISISGFALAVTYVAGGLIVNLHLSRYGITQYQTTPGKACLEMYIPLT